MGSKAIYILVAIVATIIPGLVSAQTTADEVHKLHEVLEKVYNDMIPLCSQLISVSQAMAGLGATFYIGYRIWGHIARAEPIDFYPLFRPFVMVLLIGIFPAFLSVMNGILKPTVVATEAIAEGTNKGVKKLLEQREEAIRQTKKWQVLVGESGEGDRKEWYKYTHPGESEGWLEGIGNEFVFVWQKMQYNFKNWVKLVISQILEILYFAASLCIDAIRTFHLVVLAILGPFVLAFATYDGLQHTLTVWISRYINVFLWLPIANIFSAILGKIQENLLKMDLEEIFQSGDSFFNSTDVAYLVFMLIGIVGFFTVPSLANYVVHASGASAILSKVTNMSGRAASSTAMRSYSGVTGAGDMAIDGLYGNNKQYQNMADANYAEPHINEKGGYQANKIAGT